MTDDSESLLPIVQVIGVAYTYKPSLAVRHHLTKTTLGDHSSKDRNFSYFYKGDQKSILGHNQKLYLRNDPATGEMARHWPEPELAILLGRRHSVVAYTLANDLTAISIEARGRTAAVDGTYEGKVWFKSGSLGPRFLPASAIDNAYKLEIGLTIERSGRTLYNQSYSTSRSLRSFVAIPNQIVSCFTGYKTEVPPSKKIQLDAEGFLVPGTVVMLGTGLIVSDRCALQPGDETIISCRAIGELRNLLTAQQELTERQPNS